MVLLAADINREPHLALGAISIEAKAQCGVALFRSSKVW
jgi:hypothetical protein